MDGWMKGRYSRPVHHRPVLGSSCCMLIIPSHQVFIYAQHEFADSLVTSLTQELDQVMVPVEQLDAGAPHYS